MTKTDTWTVTVTTMVRWTDGQGDRRCTWANVAVGGHCCGAVRRGARWWTVLQHMMVAVNGQHGMVPHGRDTGIVGGALPHTHAAHTQTR